MKSFVRTFDYNGKKRECFVMREIVTELPDGKGKLSEFDGFELTYLNDDEREAVQTYFKEHEVKNSFAASSGDAENGADGYDPTWMKKSWRHYKNVSITD